MGRPDDQGMISKKKPQFAKTGALEIEGLGRIVPGVLAHTALYIRSLVGSTPRRRMRIGNAGTIGTSTG